MKSFTAGSLGVISLSDVIPVLGDITDQLEKIPRLLGQLESEAVADIKAVRDDIVNWIKNNLEQPAKIVDGYLFAVSAKQLIAQQISVAKGKVDNDISSLAALAKTFGNRILALPTDLQAKLQQSGVPIGLTAEDLAAFDGALRVPVSDVSKLLSSSQTSIGQLFSDLTSSFQSRQTTFLTDLVTKIEGELQNSDAVGVFNDLVNLPGSLKSQIEKSLQYGTLFPEGRTLLYQQVQGMRNFINTAGNSATALVTTSRKILDEDIQQLRRVANATYQNAIDAAEKVIRAEIDSIESDIEQALDGAVKNLSTYFDAIWNQIVTILAAITDAKVLELIAQLQTIRDQINAFRDLLSKPVQLTATLNWTPTIHNYPESGPAIFELVDLQNSKHHLNLAVKVTANVQINNPAASQAHYSVDGSLLGFKVHLLPPIMDLIVVEFESLNFHAQDGAKANIVPQIKQVSFVGVLEFVQTFQDIIQGLNQDTGPYIDIEPTYIEAGLRLAIPDLSCGAFSLTNMNLSSALSVPLTGEPVRLRFSFSDLQNPCTLRVGIYGGSMYVGLAVGLDGIEKFEGSIEFGGSFDIGIAGISGTAFAHAGLYYAHSGQMSTLGGFFHAGGNFDLFDIASVYIDIFVGLMYETGGERNSAYGEVTVSVSVSIGFFTFSYGFTYVKEVQGSGSGQQQQMHQTRTQMSQHKLKNSVAAGQNANALQPPSYLRRVEEMLTEQDWEIYREAFAA